MPGFDPSSAQPVYDSSTTPEDYFGAVRSIYPNARMTSGGRSPQHNAAVGGVPDSMHTTNQALDFQVPGVPGNQVLNSLRTHGLPETEALNEGNHLHVGWRPRGGNPTPQGFDPSSATPVNDGGFDPTSATPVAPARAPGATGFGMVGQMIGDLTNPNPATHDPNALESGIMGISNSSLMRGVRGTFHQAIMTGLAAEPVRASMEALGVGRQPGESNANLHQRYNDAITTARQQATAEADSGQVGTGLNNTASLVDGVPRPTLVDRAARLGQQALNFGAGMAANPQYFLIPGMSVGNSVAARVATAGAANAGIGGVSDAAAQVMDMAEGQKRDFDVKQNLMATLESGLFGAGLHGAIEVAPHVASMFRARGLDTTPQADPRLSASRIAPMTTDHIAMNATDHAQYQSLLQTGSVDDIKNFFKGRNGPQPSWSDVNTWVEHRDGTHAPVNGQPGTPNPEMQPDFNYNDQYNQHAEAQHNERNRTAVEDHINSKMAGWSNAPNVEVVHSPADIADPDIRAQALKDDHPTTGEAPGAPGFYGADGKLHIYSGRVQSPEHANAILYHEGLGHFGLAEKFGSRLDSVLQSMLDRNVNGLSRATDTWMKKNKGAYNGNRLRAAEEVLAEQSEKGPLPKSWRDAVGHTINQFGRRMGLKLAYSDGEVRHILAMAHDAVINGKPSVRANGFRDGNKFMYIGRKAQGFNPATAFEGSDGHLRNEISDRGASLNQTNDPYQGSRLHGNTLGEILNHPELFTRYPELRDLPVTNNNSHDSAGHYDSGDSTLGKHINIAPGLNGQLGTTLHEVQHAIQHIEEQPHFMRAMERGGTAADGMDSDSYFNHPSEIEARDTDARQRYNDLDRKIMPRAKFMRADPLGRELTDDNQFDMVDRLKTDPRFWTDREYRQNIIELARTRFPPDGPVNKFMRAGRYQEAKEPDYHSEDPERVYRALEENYHKSSISWDETQTEALKNGISPSTIKSLKGRDPGELASRVYRLGAATNLADAKLRDLEERIGTPQETQGDKVAYIKALADFNYMAPRFKGETSEAGRALNIAKAFPQYSNATLSEIAEALREHGEDGLANLAEDPDSFNKFVRALQLVRGKVNTNPLGVQTMLRGVQRPYWEQYLTTFHMNMMLSALSTHVKAPIDMATGISRNVIEKALAIPVGKARNLYQSMTGKPLTPGVEVGELVAHVAGIIRAVSTGEVYRAVAHATKKGESSYVDAGGRRVPTQFANQFGATSNPRIPIISKPTDLISAQDTFFRSVEMNAQLETQGFREARSQLGPKASMTDVMTLGNHLAANPTRTMIKDAYDLTNRTLLLNSNPLNRLVDRARTYRPGMNIGERIGAFVASNLAPFIRVESNSLINRIIQRSPLGLLDPYTLKQIKGGGAGADIAVTKIAYGTVLLGMYWMAADATKNYLTGNGSGNVDQYKEDIASGWRPNAVHENGTYNTGGELGMSVNPFDMHNKTAQMVASMRQAYDAGANQGQVGTGMMLAFGSMSHNLADQSWVSDIEPAMAAVMAHGQEGPNVVSQFASKEASSWMPNLLSQGARLTDPVQRDTNSETPFIGQVGNTLASAVPGLRQGLPVKYSVYGTPLANGASLTGVHTWIPGLSGNGTTETHDPAERELDRLNSILPDIKSHLSAADAALLPTTLVTPVQHTIKLEDGTPKHLSPAEFEAYQQRAGRDTVDYIRQEMATPAWQAMSDQEKVEEVRSTETDMKANAREALFEP